MIPEKFKWLESGGTLPKMVLEALGYIGIKELAGKKNNNPVIMNMAKELGIADLYPNDEMAWCALFMCFIAMKTGKPQPFKGYHMLRAKSFETWGNPVRRTDAQLGDILVFARTGGGHVGLYIAETSSTFWVLGGNQGNSVSITQIEKSRLTAVRRFYATAPPESAKKYFVDSSGVISKNEA